MRKDPERNPWTLSSRNGTIKAVACAWILGGCDPHCFRPASTLRDGGTGATIPRAQEAPRLRGSLPSTPGPHRPHTLLLSTTCRQVSTPWPEDSMWVFRSKSSFRIGR